MKRRKNGKGKLILYIIFLLILSLSILLMPIASINKEAIPILVILSGGCFWTGVIGTVVTAIKIGKIRKKGFVYADERPVAKRIGLISFFQNREAAIADVAMAVSLVCFITIRICTGNLYWLFTFLSVFVFSFGMHCMLNGKSYCHLNHKVRREEKS